MPSAKDYEGLLARAAESFRLDINLIKAICAVESSWIPNATRFEKDWKYFNNPRSYAEKLDITYAEEVKNQATSFGLMQVMGGVARDEGFTDDLNMLKHPDIGIFYGCKKLQHLFQTKMCNNEEEKVVAAYNAGSPRMTEGGLYENQQYVDKVYAVLRDLRKLK